jgi:hypothetical protein
MYPAGISHPRRGRTVAWRANLCVVVFAGGSVALTIPSAVCAQEAVDENKVIAEVDPHTTAVAADDADADAADSEPERRPSTAAVELAAVARDAQDATVKPESPQVQQVCRKISVTGTRFTRRECRTLEQWAEVEAQRSERGRRFVRDVQSQSSVVPPPRPGENIPEGRPSGLPNPAGL